MDTIGQPPSGTVEGVRPARTPELLMPAGGFDAAIAAFEGGADAVYLGFRDFSARKQARNFDRDEYRRLLGHARNNGKRVYVTLNTVMTEAELPKVSELLVFLSRFSPDAIIFQDWGLASLIHEEFPSLALHASTQTAIQTPEAARLASSVGVSRIVLPRECGLEDLRRFASEAPDLEYEVFVHGALCYSFSGLCLASGLLLGRSGNRGECAQVCRSFYRRDDGRNGYWFSCRDLCLVADLAALAEAGAASFKVEGRMKSPEYVYAVARLYRAAIDHADAEAMAQLLEDARTAFSRSPTKAYLRAGNGEDLIDSSYPGHRGSLLGKVVSADRRSVVAELVARLGLRDGVMALGPGTDAQPGSDGPPPGPIMFSAVEIRDARSGRPLVTARPGSLVELAVPEDIAPGSELRILSSREADRRKVSQEEFETAVESIRAELSVSASPEGPRLALELHGPAGGVLAAGENRGFVDGEIAPLEPARSEGGFLKALGLFSESGDADFRFDTELSASPASLAGGERKLADLFLPPSFVKKSKNRFYADVRTWLAKAAELRAGEGFPHRIPPIPALDFEAPPRKALSFPSDTIRTGLPFLPAGLLAEEVALPVAAGREWLPLSPLVADWSSYSDSVSKLVGKRIAEGHRLVVGIDALHHIPLAARLRELDPAGDFLSFYGDIHLYCANSRALDFWRRSIPGLAFAYAWLEDGEGLALHGVKGLAEPGADFEPPLFLSRGCYVRHNLQGGNCPASCRKRYSFPLSDRERRYKVVVDGCITMLFRDTSLPQRQAMG